MSPRNRGWVILTIGIAGFVGVGVALQLGAVLGGTEAPSLSPLGGLVEVVFGRVKASTTTWVLLGLVGVAIVYAVARFVPAKSTRAGGEVEANDRIGRASDFASAREKSRMKETREVLHPEAVARFHALYEEYLKAAGAGEMSSWWVHHWDAHAKALFDPNTGVFRHCSPKMHTDGDDAVRFSLVDGDDSPEYLAAIDDPNPNWYTGDQ